MTHRAAPNSHHRLNALFWPRSIAVVGASDNPVHIRGRTFFSLRACDFDGPIYPITRSREALDGLRCYPDIASLPETPDLAIVVVPAAAVETVLTQCGERGVPAAVVISSGFAEQGDDEGHRRQAALQSIAQRYAMVISGPNAEGFLNARLGLAATFSPVVNKSESLPGFANTGVGIVSQSGGVGFAFYDRGQLKGLNPSHVVSMGNEASLESLEVVDYLLDDEGTDTVAWFLEGFRQTDTLAATAAKAASLEKPLVVAKMGRHEAAAKAAASHTASLAGSFRSCEALFKYYGMTVAADIEELVDLVNAFACFKGRFPTSRRVGVLTPSGGAGIWLTDTCEAAGLEVVELDEETQTALAQLMPAYGNTHNPVDITAQGIFQFGYAKPLEILARSPRIDAVITACSMARPQQVQEDAQNLRVLAQKTDKPIIFCSYTTLHPDAVAGVVNAGFLCTNSMPNAARAVAAMVDYQEFQARFAARKEHSGSQLKDGYRNALLQAPRTLCEFAAKQVLDLAGVNSSEADLVQTAEAAIGAWRRLGTGVALKVQSSELPHKTEAGAIALGLDSAAAIESAFDAVLSNVKAYAPRLTPMGVLVQKMAAPGIEMIVGAKVDAEFGPMVMVGLGGVWVEVLDDVALAPAPLSPNDARHLIDGLRGCALLSGVRGARPSDVDALVDLLVALSQFIAAECKLIESIDLNPVIVHSQGEGLSLVDALIVKVPTLSAVDKRKEEVGV